MFIVHVLLQPGWEWDSIQVWEFYGLDQFTKEQLVKSKMKNLLLNKHRHTKYLSETSTATKLCTSWRTETLNHEAMTLSSIVFIPIEFLRIFFILTQSSFINSSHMKEGHAHDSLQVNHLHSLIYSLEWDIKIKVWVREKGSKTPTLWAHFCFLLNDAFLWGHN